MRTLPDTPPSRMVFGLAIEFAKRGYYIRPLSWTGSDEEAHELAWLHYPAGFPLAQYVSAETGAEGRPWKADDLDRADWFAWWTCLPPDCFEPDADGNTAACLCDDGDVNFTWSFYAFPTDATALDGLLNPNAFKGVKNCGEACDCGTTGGTNPVTPMPLPPTPVTPTPVSPVPGPGNPGSPGGPGGANPRPSASGAGGAGGSGGPPKKRDPDPPKVGPAVVLSAILTSPSDECSIDAQPQSHTWAIGIALTNPANVHPGPYSVQIRVLGEIVETFLLAPGGSDSANYTRSIAADADPLKALGSGSAFGAGPSCTPGECDLEPIPLCDATTTTTTTTTGGSSEASSGGGSGATTTTTSEPPSSTASSEGSSAGSEASSESYEPVSLGYDAGASGPACSLGGGTTYYCTAVTPSLGESLYTTAGGGTPVPDGYYSNGGQWWQVSGGSGLITADGSCA